jgi:hypothetical protein
VVIADPQSLPSEIQSTDASQGIYDAQHNRADFPSNFEARSSPSPSAAQRYNYAVMEIRGFDDEDPKEDSCLEEA